MLAYAQLALLRNALGVASTFATVEWHLGGSSGSNSPGASILLGFLFLAVVTCFALGHMADLQLLVRPKKLPGLSGLGWGANAPAGAAKVACSKILPNRSRYGRRGARRWGGNPVAVRLADSERAPLTRDGLVLDRSRGGLLLAAPKPAAVGSICWVQATRVTGEVQWVPVQIRHCRPQDDRWLWGCKFRRAVPWGVLFFFGLGVESGAEANA